MIITQMAAAPPLPPPQMPLALASPGQHVIISAVRGGRRWRQRLQELGLHPGSRIRIVKNDMPGPMIVAVKEDGRLALGRGMTQQIMVTPVSKPA